MSALYSRLVTCNERPGVDIVNDLRRVKRNVWFLALHPTYWL